MQYLVVLMLCSKAVGVASGLPVRNTAVPDARAIDDLAIMVMKSARLTSSFLDTSDRMCVP